MCMANVLHNRQLCFILFRKSLKILGLQFKNDAIEFTRILERIDNKDDQSVQQISVYAEYLLRNMQKIHDLWIMYYPAHKNMTLQAIQTVEQKIQNDGNVAGWPITDAYYIWSWIHIIAIDLDLNGGYAEKHAFFRIISELIGCGQCRHHYLQHYDELIKSLQITTCANTLLALHTFVNAYVQDEINTSTNDAINNQQNMKTTTAATTTTTTTTGENRKKYTYNVNLVNLFFSNKYRRDYLTLQLNDE